MSYLETEVNLKDLPVRMTQLPIDPQRRIPVPWFVQWIDGKPEFRIMDFTKWKRAVDEKLCWVCGQRLGAYLTFVIGPMCVITRTTSEPPSHRGCAQWSARNCPFLSRPHMRRREDGLPEEVVGAAGVMIPRNPGAMALWTARRYKVFHDDQGQPLIEIGDLDGKVEDALEWYAQGRSATRAEVQESIDTGLPILMEIAEREGPHAVKELRERVARIEPLLPPE